MVADRERVHHPGWARAVALLGSVATAIGYLLAVWWSGLGDVTDAVLGIGVSGMGLALALSLVSFGLRYGRWLWYLDALRHRLPLRLSLRYYFAGFFFILTPAKSGELIRCLYLKGHGVPYAHGVSTFLAERIADVAAMTVLAMVAGAGHLDGYGVWLGLVALPPALLMAVLSSGRLRARVRRRVERLPSTWVRESAFRALRAVEAVSVLLTGRLLAGGLALGLVAWGAQGAVLYAVLAGIGVEEVSLPVAVGVYAVSSLLGSLTLVPGGLGGADVAMGALLVAAGASPAEAVVATLVCRAATLGFAVALGALAMLSIHAPPVRRHHRPIA